MPPTDTIETLREANGNLHSALFRLRPEQNREQGSGPCQAQGPERADDSSLGLAEVSLILNQLLRVAECLRREREHSAGSLPPYSKSPDYLINLKELKDLLPQVHARLIVEKSFLESARIHLASATAWSQASQKTL